MFTSFDNFVSVYHVIKRGRRPMTIAILQIQTHNTYWSFGAHF